MSHYNAIHEVPALHFISTAQNRRPSTTQATMPLDCTSGPTTMRSVAKINFSFRKSLQITTLLIVFMRNTLNIEILPLCSTIYRLYFYKIILVFQSKVPCDFCDNGIFKWDFHVPFLRILNYRLDCLLRLLTRDMKYLH